MKGLIQVYTGDGKGKTTAALGLCFRALGHGYKVAFVQFLKGSSYTGELFSSKLMGENFHYAQFGWGCPFSSLIREGYMSCKKCGQCFRENRDKSHGFARLAFEHIKQLVSSNKYDIIVMDEISHALRHELLPIEEVVAFLKNKPEHMEFILTGRYMAPEIIELAQLVTEMKMHKHPLKDGFSSRRGIEF